MNTALSPVEKSAQTPIFFDFFFHTDGGWSPLTRFPLVCRVFHLFVVKKQKARPFFFSYTLAGFHLLTWILPSSNNSVQGPQKKKLPEKVFLKYFICYFFALWACFCQNELIGMSNNLNFPSCRCQINFLYYLLLFIAFGFNVLSWQITFVISSSSNLIFSPVTGPFFY